MTAPTMLKAEAELIAHAQAVRSRAQLIDWTDDDDKNKAIGEALTDLTGLLEKYWDLLNEVIHYDAYEWPVDDDPRAYSEPFEVALRMAAKHADEAAGYLLEVINKYCVAGDAALVSDEGES